MSKKLIIIAIALVGLVATGLLVFNREKTSATMPGSMVIKSFNFGYSPNVIKVKQGEMVMLKLISDDSPHTFTIDDLGIDKQFTFGNDVPVMFTPTQKGTFQFYCAVPDHKESGMVGTLVVE